MGVLLYTASLKRIPQSLYEAADIDAASGWSKFWRITWPLLKPTTLYVLVIQLIESFQTFSGAFFITRGGPIRSTEFVNWRIYETFYRYGNFGLASAMAVILMIVIMAISLVNFKLFGTDVEY
jgi:multiple sugar transport system permease protein